MAASARFSFIKDRLFLWILLAVFILLKLPHLDYPFYWDECWPYATAIRRMYDAGPGLMPTIIPADYSRGHPLLFHFLAAVWMKLFGTSHIAMHAFPLLLSILGIYGIYEACLKLFNRNVAMTGSLLVSFQVMFFVQSSFLLPEVFLAFLGFFSIYFYARRRYFLTVLFLTALFYTKESGLVVGLVLGLHALCRLFRKQEPVRERIGNFVSVAIPVALIGLFFIIQKITLGWYVFPFHTGLIELQSGRILTKLRGCFDVIFVHDLRQYYLLLLLVLFAALAIVRRHIKPALDILKQLWRGENREQGRFLRLLIMFIPFFFAFTSINIFIGRYLLIALLPVLLTGAVLLEKYAAALWPETGVAALLVVIAGMELTAFYKNKGHGDTDLGAYNGMQVHQKVVDYLEQHNYYHAHVASNANLERMHLTDPYTGYLKGTDTFDRVTVQITDTTDIAVFDNIEPGFQYEQVRADTGFLRVFRVEQGSAWAEIYVRKEPLHGARKAE